VNIGLLASVGRTFYLRPHLRRDATAISSALAATVALISIEGFTAEKYLQTSRGQEEERRAKKEGALVFRHTHEQIMRPRVLGGIVGIGEYYFQVIPPVLMPFISQYSHPGYPRILLIRKLG
jgi:hypothetical protein